MILKEQLGSPKVVNNPKATKTFGKRPRKDN
jgi:hypothetical protein